MPDIRSHGGSGTALTTLNPKLFPLHAAVAMSLKHSSFKGRVLSFSLCIPAPHALSLQSSQHLPQGLAFSEEPQTMFVE